VNYYASTICTETSVMSLTFFSELICVSTICTERDNFSFHLTFTEHETLILSTIACIIIRPTFSPSNFRNCDPSCIIDSHDGPASPCISCRRSSRRVRMPTGCRQRDFDCSNAHNLSTDASRVESSWMRSDRVQ